MSDAPGSRRPDWVNVWAFRVLPVTVVLLAALAGSLKWQDTSRRAAEAAAVESVSVARETTVAMLSYSAGTAEKDLNAARNRLTGSFLTEFTKLIHEVVIPGAKEKNISAVAAVAAGGSVSATLDRAVALVFIDQSVTIGGGAPTNTVSSARVTLDKVGGRWLVSGFDPV